MSAMESMLSAADKQVEDEQANDAQTERNRLEEEEKKQKKKLD